MATAVSIAIRRDVAQSRIQSAAITLASQNGIKQVDLAPQHKQAAIQEVLTLEAVADFLETLATQSIAEAVPEPELAKPRSPKSASRKPN